MEDSSRGESIREYPQNTMENFVREGFYVPVISYVEPQNSVRNFDVRQNSMENPRNSPKFGLSSEIKQTDNHNAKRCSLKMRAISSECREDTSRFVSYILICFSEGTRLQRARWWKPKSKTRKNGIEMQAPLKTWYGHG